MSPQLFHARIMHDHKFVEISHLISSPNCNLSSWTFIPLNFLVRVVLLNSILQVMPLYLFSIMETPKNNLNNIHNL